MPGKKGKKGKSSKKKGKKSKSVDKGNVEKKEPMAPDYVPPPPWPGQQVVDPAFWEKKSLLQINFTNKPSE